MMKRRYTLGLILSFLLVAVKGYSYDFLSNGIYYSINGNNVAVTMGDTKYKGEIVIPDHVSYNGKDYTVTSIESSAFQNCNGLTSITIPNSVTSIGSYAFYKCSGLTSITIPNSVTSIGNNAFVWCSGLTSITIPNSVTSIGDGAFAYCSGLIDVISEIQNPFEIESGVFWSSYSKATLTVPNGTKSEYQQTNYWNEFEHIVESSGGSSTSRTIHVYPAGSLPSLISESEKYTIDELTLTGELNGTDFRLLRDMAGNNYLGQTTGGKLKTLDLSGAKVVAGGEKYLDTDQQNGKHYQITQANEIPMYVFYGCYLKNILIPNSVTSIRESAFYYCQSLTSITISNSVTSIYNSAFWDCSSLSSIKVDNNNPKYDSRNNCNAIIETSTNTLIMGFKSTVIPNSVTSIGDYAFFDCSSLISINIPNSVKSIGSDAFKYCIGLTSITIPNSVTSIGNYAFNGCSSLTDVISEIQNPFKIARSVFYLSSYTEATLTVPSGTKSKYQQTDGWNKFTNIVESSGGGSSTSRTIHVYPAGSLPSLISESEKYTIEELTLTGELNGTDFRLLRDMSGNNYLGQNTEGKLKMLDLSGAKVVAGGEKYLDTDEINGNGISASGSHHYQITQANEIPTHVFFGCYLKNILIPNSVTSIGESAFQGCRDLTSITIPNSVTSIGGSAFSFCTGLTSITIPNSVTSIGYAAFSGCSGLTSITIPNSVTTIGYYAFEYCSGLTSITIPNSVTSIGGGAFRACCGLSAIKVDNNNPKYDSRNNCNAIIETSTNTLITGCKNTVIPNTVTCIGNSAFYNCSGLTSITIPNSVTSIGNSAFSQCNGLTSITIPNSVTSIGNSAFSECTGLTSITIPNSVTTIGEYAFGVCYGLTSITIPYSVTSIGNSAFMACGLTSIKVDNNNIKYDSRNNCNAIVETSTNTLIIGCKNTVIPNTVTSIGNSAFSQCDGLTSITIPNSVTSIGDYAFYYCNNLASITIPNSVTNLGLWTFIGCSGLTSITIPNSVTSIGDHAFNNCSSLTSIISEIKDPFAIDESVFSPSYTKATLTVPSGTKSKYQQTDYWNKFTNIKEKEGQKYSLSITASGYGYAYYDGTSIRNTTRSFTVNDGASVTITFSPDNGYRIKNVKLNSTNVTSNVSNNQYTISNINANTTLEVEFEAIPVTTYTLSIKATGNGSASYNGTTIRSKTSTFTVNEGTKVSITLTPDNGYRIKSVKENDTNVTSYVLNGTYTINSISRNTTVEVEFEAIPPTTYTLSLKATGNGSVSYDGNTIRGKTSTFTVNDGESVTISISPDSGYRLKSIKENGSEVTAYVSNNRYTISSIGRDTNIEVEFEAIPVPTYTLRIIATGNGSATYDETSVRNETTSFTVNEGTNAIVTFSPDNGNSIASVKVNNNDVTSQVSGNRYTINNITANTTLTVTFQEDVNAMTVDGVNYTVVSQTDRTVKVTGGDFGQVLTVPATVTQNGKTWTVTGIDANALKNNTELAAVIWNPAYDFTATVSNPNLLLYVKAEQYAPSSIQNVVVNGTASNIVLKEASSGNNFYCPQSFVAQKISYTHNYQMQTGLGESKGWETIALPFDVQTITHETKGTIVPFAQWNNSSNKKPFWLMELTGTGFVEAGSIKAYTPYIISMPNNPQYDSQWQLKGKVTFAASSVTVGKTENLNQPIFNGRTLIPCFAERKADEGFYALNVNNDWETNNSGMTEGSKFVLNMRRIHPFEAYMTSSSNAAPYFDVFDDMTTGIHQMVDGRWMKEEAVYDLQGRKVENLSKKGVYIRNGKKITK